VVEPTHLKNMLVKMDHFPGDRGENKKYLSCHHPVIILDLLGWMQKEKVPKNILPNGGLMVIRIPWDRIPKTICQKKSKLFLVKQRFFGQTPLRMKGESKCGVISATNKP